MLTRVWCFATLAAAVLAGCGGDDDGDRGGATAATPATTAGPAAPPGQVADQDRLPAQPQVALDFRTAATSELTTDPGATARTVADALELRLRAAGPARVVPREPPPPDRRMTLVIARVRDARRLGGRAGIFCHGDRGANGYELTLDRAGAVRLDRIADGRRTTLTRGQARLEAAGDSPIPLFLVCGRGDERTGPHVVFTVGAQEAVGVRDPSPLPPGSGSGAGMVVDGERGDSARFTVLTLTYGP